MDLTKEYEQELVGYDDAYSEDVSGMPQYGGYGMSDEEDTTSYENGYFSY